MKTVDRTPRSEVHQQIRLQGAGEALERYRLNKIIKSYKTVQTAKDIELKQCRSLARTSLLINYVLFVFVVALLAWDWF